MDNIHRDPSGMADVEEFVRHEPCEECGSSDAKAVYSSGSAFCFSCRTYFPPEGEQRKPMTSKVSLRGEARALPSRGLSAKTCEKYKIYRDGDYLRQYYFSPDGQLIGCKSKSKSKDFFYEGESDGISLVSTCFQLVVDGL